MVRRLCTLQRTWASTQTCLIYLIGTQQSHRGEEGDYLYICQLCGQLDYELDYDLDYELGGEDVNNNGHTG